jgi:hypothetical protein
MVTESRGEEEEGVVMDRMGGTWGFSGEREKVLLIELNNESMDVVEGIGAGATAKGSHSAINGSTEGTVITVSSVCMSKLIKSGTSKLEMLSLPESCSCEESPKLNFNGSLLVALTVIEKFNN